MSEEHMSTGRPEAGRYYAGLYSAAQSELAALREELAEIKESLAYRGSLLNRTQQRAEAAEQRNATLTKALADTREALGREYWDQYAGLDETRDILDAALKPTESGASDKCISDGGTCGLGGQCAECPHKELGASE